MRGPSAPSNRCSDLRECGVKKAAARQKFLTCRRREIDDGDRTVAAIAGFEGKRLKVPGLIVKRQRWFGSDLTKRQLAKLLGRSRRTRRSKSRSTSTMQLKLF
jgi:hypothetical protein